jgi:hypothetical protein
LLHEAEIICEETKTFRENDGKHTTAVVVEGVEEGVQASVEGNLIVKLGEEGVTKSEMGAYM